MYKNYKFRIYPNQKQKQIIEETFKSYKFVYNFWLERKKEEDKKWRQNNNLSYELSDWGNELKYIKNIIDYSFLKNVEASCLQRALYNLNNDILSYRRRKKGYPPEISEYSNYYITGNSNNNVYLKDDYIKLPKVKKVKANLYKQIPDNWKIKNARVIKTSNKKYYVILLYQYYPYIEPKDLNKCVTLKHTFEGIYENQNGEIIKFPERLQYLNKKLETEIQKHSRMVYNSNNYSKQLIKIEKIREKIKNFKRNYLHKITRELVNEYDCIKIKYPKRDELSIYVEDYDWITFTAMLKQKLEEEGKELIKR